MMYLYNPYARGSIPMDCIESIHQSFVDREHHITVIFRGNLQVTLCKNGSVHEVTLWSCVVNDKSPKSQEFCATVNWGRDSVTRSRCQESIWLNIDFMDVRITRKNGTIQREKLNLSILCTPIDSYQIFLTMQASYVKSLAEHFDSGILTDEKISGLCSVQFL